jgi:hypothetical protein
VHLYGHDAIEAFRSVLRETHPEELSAANELIDWATNRELDLTFESRKRQLRFRMPGASHKGQSVFCLNPQVRDNPPDVDVELRWLLGAAAFKPETRANELIERLQRVPGWHRPPSPRPDLNTEGFPNIWLARLRDAGATATLLEQLGWIVDSLD